MCRHLATVGENQLCGSNKNWLPQQRPLRDRKTNIKPYTCSHSYIDPANWVKISLVDIETIDLTEMVKNNYTTTTTAPV